jgi:hypothetical protein
VVRWEWWTWVAYSYEPAYFELAKESRGHPLDAEVGPTTHGAHGYGLDGEGRVVIERENTEFPGRYYETFFVSEVGGIAAHLYSYDPAKDWINVTWLAFGAPGIVDLHSVAPSGNWLSVAYQYDEHGRLIGCRRSGIARPYPDVADAYTIEYDDAGRITKVHRVGEDGQRHLHFELPDPDATLAAGKPALMNALTLATIEALRERALDDAVYCVALAYSGAAYHEWMPPLVYVGRAAERARFREEHGDEAPDYVWNPAEWSESEVDLELSPDVARLCASVCQDIWQNELDAEFTRFLFDLARQIEAAELPCRRAEHFAVVVIQLDEGDAAAQVASQVGEDAARALRDAGWL